MDNRPLAAVIMAAGQGKRMKNPDKAKVMHTLAGIPLVEHVVRLARSVGCARIIVVVGHQRQSVIDHLTGIDPSIEFAVQEQQLGTGHAVRMTETLLRDFEGDILILSGDAPLTREGTIREALRKHRTADAAVTVLTAVLPDPDGYGRIIRDRNEHILRIVEQKDADAEERSVHEINSGIYVFRRDVLFDALERITNDNAQGEYYLPDVFAIFRREDRVMVPHVVERFDELRGVNTIDQLMEMEHILAEPED